jgi:hypothetical protein
MLPMWKVSSERKTIEELERAIELAQLLHKEVASSSHPDHKCIEVGGKRTWLDPTECIFGSACPPLRGNNTTLGISFDEKNASVTACMVGGPAFLSRRVNPNDVFVAIDGQEVKGPEITGLLIGNDKPGSVVELTLKRASVGPCLFCFMAKRRINGIILRLSLQQYLFYLFNLCHPENHNMV